MSAWAAKKLTIRPYPLAHEGARGYVQRLATVNGLHSVGSMNPPKIFLSLDELSGLLGRDDRAFWEKHPENAYWHRPVGKCRQAWIWKNRKYCPACLLECSFWRVEWELKGMSVCPKHQVKLVDTCTSCNHPLSWHTQVLAECQCGFNLTQINPESCSDAERVLGLAVTARLGQNECPEHLHFLEHLKLEALFALTNYLGRIGTANGTNSPGSFKAAASILNEWPAKYRSILVGIQHKNKSEDGVPSISHTFGKAYTDLYLPRNLESLEVVREEFESHVNENWDWPIDEKNRRLPQKMRSNHAWIPASRAGMELNVRYQNLLKLITERDIESKTVLLPSGRQYLAIRQRDLEKIHEIITNKVTLLQASKMLGLSEKRVKLLIKSSVLQTYSKYRNSADKWEIARESLSRLLEMGQEVPEIDAVGKDHFPIKNLARSGLRNRSVFPLLIKEIVGGRIEVTARLRNATGVGGWVIARSQYERWRKSEIEREKGEIYSIQEVAQVLRVKQSVAYQLANYGLLKIERNVYDGFVRAITTRANIDEFRSRYVFGRDLARELDTSPTKIISVLADMGVYPTSALQKAVKLQAVFEKSSEFLRCWDAVLELSKNHWK